MVLGKPSEEPLYQIKDGKVRLHGFAEVHVANSVGSTDSLVGADWKRSSRPIVQPERLLRRAGGQREPQPTASVLTALFVDARAAESRQLGWSVGQVSRVCVAPHKRGSGLWRPSEQGQREPVMHPRLRCVLA